MTNEWPWYSQVAPASWRIGRDVIVGRRELNFSVWATYEAPRQRKSLQESLDRVRDGDMPPWFYELLHPTARLDAADREILQHWMEAELAGLEGP